MLELSPKIFHSRIVARKLECRLETKFVSKKNSWLDNHRQLKIGLTFSSALRSIVRQDPDIIMIGEMRDLETAKIAVQSALTGHLVLSTLHTNDAAGALARLLDMGLDDYLLTSTVNGILAQRLVRKLCMHCREPYQPLAEVIQEKGLSRFLKNGELT